VDARKVGALFKRSGAEVESRLLVNEQATAGGIKAALRQVKDEARPGDFIVLFLAGHGTPTRDGWVFLPHDYDRKNPAPTVIFDTDLLEEADALAARGHNVLLSVEACHSGLLETKAKTLGLIGTTRPKKRGRGGLVLAASCLPHQFSTVSRVSGEGFTGWFSTALRQGLGGEADQDHNGVVSVAELRNFLQARLYVIKHAVVPDELPKLPGLAWQDQDGICVGSPEAPDGLEIIRADPKKGRSPEEVKDEGYLPPYPRDLFCPKGPAPIGTWEIATYNDGPIPGKYTLILRKDGTYTARYKDPSGAVEETKGTYRYKSGAGGEFVLNYDNGYDELLCWGGQTEDSMTIKLQSHPRSQPLCFFRLQRKKD
jgi:hypothetical protein